MPANEAFLRLREVRLEKFKAAFKPDPIAVGDFQLIIGRNGSGKSTLLEALQWLDRTLRQDARAACDRYFGIRDLINMRSRAGVPYFELTLTWTIERASAANSNLTYSVRVEQGSDNATPLVASETLFEQVVGTRRRAYLIKTRDTKREAGRESGTRVIYPDNPELRTNFEEPDRLALARGGMRSRGQGKPQGVFDLIQDFWSRAVFLRLSPNRLVAGSPANRRSFDPILDEEGQALPALLNELSKEQLADLSKDLGASVHGIEGVKVIGRTRTSSTEDKINYQLRERMPYVGRSGSTVFPVPSWMLSEGTRRLTAIFALLVRTPPPSLLCVEEIENGLDPKTTERVLLKLRSAADLGTQVLLTTHSPWLLDHVDINHICQVVRQSGDTRYLKFADRKEVMAFHESVPPGTRYVHEAQ